MDAFIGEIRMFCFSFLPQGWLACNGDCYPISQYQALSAVIGRLYGSAPNGQFRVPNLSGLTTVGVGNNPTDIFAPAMASTGGKESVTLTDTNMPLHTHSLNNGVVPAAARTTTAMNNWLCPPIYVPTSGSSQNSKAYAAYDANTAVAFNNNTLTPFSGQGKPHENRQPYLALGYFINFDGLFPQRP